MEHFPAILNSIPKNDKRKILADFLESLANSGSCKSSKIFRQSCHVLRCRKSFKDWNNCSKCKPNRPLIAGAGHDDDGESSSWTDMSSMTKQLLGTFQQQLVNASDEQAKKHHNNPLALKISEVLVEFIVQEVQDPSNPQAELLRLMLGRLIKEVRLHGPVHGPSCYSPGKSAEFKLRPISESSLKNMCPKVHRKKSHDRETFYGHQLILDGDICPMIPLENTQKNFSLPDPRLERNA